MLARYWWAVVWRLDRPGRRGLLTLPGSVWVSLTYRAPCLVYWRDAAADDGGPGDLRTKSFVREFVMERDFLVTTRDDAPDAWTRDYVYAVNTRAA